MEDGMSFAELFTEPTPHTEKFWKLCRSNTHFLIYFLIILPSSKLITANVACDDVVECSSMFVAGENVLYFEIITVHRYMHVLVHGVVACAAKNVGNEFHSYTRGHINLYY